MRRSRVDLGRLDAQSVLVELALRHVVGKWQGGRVINGWLMNPGPRSRQLLILVQRQELAQEIRLTSSLSQQTHHLRLSILIGNTLYINFRRLYRRKWLRFLHISQTLQVLNFEDRKRIDIRTYFFLQLLSFLALLTGLKVDGCLPVLREELVTEVRPGRGHLDGVKARVLEGWTSLVLDGLDVLCVCTERGEEMGLRRFCFFLLLLNPD